MTAKEHMSAVMEAVENGTLHTAAGLRKLSNAMWAVAHSGPQDRGEVTERAMTSNMAMLTGMACGVLVALADKMEADAQ